MYSKVRNKLFIQATYFNNNYCFMQMTDIDQLFFYSVIGGSKSVLKPVRIYWTFAFKLQITCDNKYVLIYLHLTLIHSLFHSFRDHVDYFIYSFIHSLHNLIRPFTHSFMQSFILSFNYLFIQLSVRSSACMFIHSFIHSFINFFTHLPVFKIAVCFLFH